MAVEIAKSSISYRQGHDKNRLSFNIAFRRYCSEKRLNNSRANRKTKPKASDPAFRC
jgi:hypothetical protein